MRADKVLRTIIKKCGISVDSASLQVGRSKSYLSHMFSRGSIPNTDTMAYLCNHFGWDLLVRDRKDGQEIKIDPPR